MGCLHNGITVFRHGTAFSIQNTIGFLGGESGASTSSFLSNDYSGRKQLIAGYR